MRVRTTHPRAATLTDAPRPPQDRCQVYADATRLAQALDNLISNAVKFTQASGKVEVELAQDEDRVTLTVADTGLGMAGDESERLFEPFFRTDAARAKKIQGTGLGLPIVRAIVECARWHDNDHDHEQAECRHVVRHLAPARPPTPTSDGSQAALG
jgi:signal transduction histidine kinase